MNAIQTRAPAALLCTTGRPAAITGETDAELIQFCEQVVEIERQKESLHAAIHLIEDERRSEPELDRLFLEGEALCDRLYELPDPTTIAGARAMARAALALADKNADGSIRVFEDAETFAFTVAKFLAAAVPD